MTADDTPRTIPTPRRSPEEAPDRRTRPSSDYWDVAEARWVTVRRVAARAVSSGGRAGG